MLVMFHLYYCLMQDNGAAVKQIANNVQPADIRPGEVILHCTVMLVA